MNPEVLPIGTSDPLQWVLPCPTGTEGVLVEELQALLKGRRIEARQTAVHVEATLQEGYRMCLWSRVASRVLLPLVRWDGGGDDALYEALREIRWWEHFRVSDSFAIGYSQVSSSGVPAHYWVQRAKDAIVDSFRDHGAQRPSVDKKEPALRFHLHIGGDEHALALDFSGGGQHRRGYRHASGKAPLKENLAAAILYLAGWPRAAAEGLTLLDPTCGSGTFLVEAALMAGDCAPGLGRKRFGFERWLPHDASGYQQERAAAVAKRKEKIPCAILGYDASAEALESARGNIRAAGVESWISLSEKSLSEIEKPAPRGLLVCNPPYGHRLGDESTLFLFYQTLGDTLKHRFDGWTAFVFAAHSSNLKHIGLRPARRHVLYNGAIECRLLELPIHGSPTAQADGGLPAWRKPSAKASMFANRIKKNLRKWGKQALRDGVDCYRIYDADIPEYDVAVDRYGSKAVVHVAPRADAMESDVGQQRLQDVVLTLPAALGIEPEGVVVKVRHKQSQGDQYARLSGVDESIVVHEGDLRFVVNVQDRIDTGLFLDHRKVRAHAVKHCKSKRVLNLFAYTCTVSVAAAVGGAKQTTNVDLSSTYLDWGRRNFEENGLSLEAHRFVRDDAARFMRRARETYDWIFINPPTFSRSKRTRDDFVIQRDHAALLRDAMKALDPRGELLFTTHAQGFRLDATLRTDFEVKDASEQLVPVDFARSPFEAFVFSHRS